MHHHYVLKLYQQLPGDVNIPHWIDFIHDKSVVRDRAAPPIDRVLDEAGLPFWVTKEYRLAGTGWNASEIREGLDRTYRLILQREGAVPPDMVSRLAAIPMVETAHELEIGETEVPPHRLAAPMTLPGRPARDLIHLAYAKSITQGHPEVSIAVLDTGVSLKHRELAGKIRRGADFVDLGGLDTSEFIGDVTGYDDVPEDEVGHGTHVSGIVGSRGVDMDEGVAPGCSLMAVRVLATMRSEGRRVGAGIVDNINVGIKWAVDHGADVINMSLGIKHTGGGLPHADVIRYALGKGVTVVAASGNDGTAERYYPGALPGVIAVGAVDGDGVLTRFSSYGANISVVAPGLNIYSAFANNTYAYASGTSQASPFVAGMVGLLKSYAREQGQRLSNLDIMQVLRHTSDKVDSRLRNEYAGYGLINLADAFKFLRYQLG